MPEGDTIYRTAQTLQRALAGRVVTRFDSPLPALMRVNEEAPIAGRTVRGARSLGKHLLIEFSGGLVLRTHMRMRGAWHIYRPGERWRRPHTAMRVLVETNEWVAVGFDVPIAEFLRVRDLARHRELARLGPDLLGDDFDEQAAAARLRTVGADRALSEALLDQRVMAGVGNVFKSEVLFVCEVHPSRPVSALTDDQLSRVVRSARELLRANVAPSARGARRTTRAMNPESRLWVYGRGGRPCRRCATPIACEARGESARLTYWCPKCQK